MPDLLYEKHANHAVFTFNRPERRNALTGELFRELNEALADFAADREMRAGVLTGAGGAFCAGLDLKRTAEKAERGKAPRPDSARPAEGPFSSCPKPVIAAINGVAVAGGLELAIDCDIRICSTEAYFGLFEAKRGLMPGYAIHHLARVIPFQDAMHLMLTADRIEPAEALRMGLVREVLEPDALMPRAVAIAEMIAANAPLAVQGIKAIAQAWRYRGVDESRRLARAISPAIRDSEDAREGPRAFVEKRPPRWTGR